MNVTILGTGAYGIALAMMFHENNCNITMWTRFEKEKEEIDSTRMNSKVLPGIKLPDNIKITNDLEGALSGTKLIVLAIPVDAISDVTKEIKQYYTSDMHICITTKGIEQNTNMFVSEIVSKYINTDKIAVISGGSFAIDMASKVPIGLSLATQNKETESVLMQSLENDYVRLRATRDILGIEICGSIKNVIAIASGIIDGMNYPESTKCMFITDALHDLAGLVKALGGNERSILSYAGFGDLLLTCTSSKSRNFTLGYIIGKGEAREKIEDYMNNTTIEGLCTLKSIHKIIEKKNVDIPIINLIYDIVINGADKELIIEYLRTKDRV